MSRHVPPGGSEREGETQYLPASALDQAPETCPRCQQPWQEASRYCQSCGLPLDEQALADAPPATAQLPVDQPEAPGQRASLPVVTIIMLLIILVGLYFIFSRALVVGG